MKKFTHYISLGYFCEVAQDLEKLGLREFSSPFDWVISDFSCVMKAIENGFEDYLNCDNLLQNAACRCHYYESKYHFYSFHDFSPYISLEEQYQGVKEKYDRRINRFFKEIKSPTLFIRYISSEDVDNSGKSMELDWIEQNYQYIRDVLKKYNEDNDILFIGDETVISEAIKIYHVSRDKKEKVSKLPIYNNKELYPLLQSVDFPGREENQKRYRERRKLFKRISKRARCCLQKIFLKEYKHSKTYNIVGK